MKRTLKLAIIGFAAIVCGVTGASAQKFGYVNLQEIVMAMPERDSAEVKVQLVSQDYAEQLDMIRVEYNTKGQEYQKNVATLSDAARQMKEKELRDIEVRYAEFQRDAQQMVQRQEAELMQPIIEKAQNAIKKVGIDNGFVAVFESAAMLYMDEKMMVDITPLVKKELGIKE